MILTRNEILKELKSKKIEITPLSEKNIGPASIDLTLGNEFRVFTNKKSLILDEKSDYKKYTVLVRKKSFLLMPKNYVLAITKERIKLPNNICGFISGRSRFARFGLSVYMAAFFVQPGINNKQVLEINNVSNFPVILKPGLRICQLILERTDGHAIYMGKFKSQNKL